MPSSGTIAAYGFITPDDGGRDVFVHHTAILMDGFRTLAEGQKVAFEVVETERGLQAAGVTPLGPAPGYSTSSGASE